MSAGEVAYLMLVLGAASAFVATLGYVSMIAGAPKEQPQTARSGDATEAGAGAAAAPAQ
jgi:hypothetical protein